MVTGIRRGELCALRWRSVDLDVGVLHLESSIGQRGSRVWEKSTKSPVAGSIDELPSGALRVRVYAGVDPVTKKRYDLVEVISPDPHAKKKPRRPAYVTLTRSTNAEIPHAAPFAQLVSRHLREDGLLARP